jgi:RluA family pseudouridine synthase
MLCNRIQVAANDHQVAHSTKGTSMRSVLGDRNAAIRQATCPLPGSEAYDNLRPINIPLRLDGRTLLECVVEMFPQIDSRQWQEWFRLGHILSETRPARMHRVVRGGEQFWHLFPDTVEPDVNGELHVIWEDQTLVAISKPAPLPVHPCGRFNRNTLTFLLEQVYGRNALRLVHRLDANTTGVMLLARSKSTAASLRELFANNQVRKRYLVRFVGHPNRDRFDCRLSIGRCRNSAGARITDPNGLEARTEFNLLAHLPDGTSIAEAIPHHGRTNQIRIHLWSMGMPVCGDPTYLTNGRIASRQTLTTRCPSMCLHAWSISFIHPEEERPMTLSSEPPEWTHPIAEKTRTVGNIDH